MVRIILIHKTEFTWSPSRHQCDTSQHACIGSSKKRILLVLQRAHPHSQYHSLPLTLARGGGLPFVITPPPALTHPLVVRSHSGAVRSTKTPTRLLLLDPVTRWWFERVCAVRLDKAAAAPRGRDLRRLQAVHSCTQLERG